jgi:hypothetical protein
MRRADRDWDLEERRMANADGQSTAPPDARLPGWKDYLQLEILASPESNDTAAGFAAASPFVSF